MGATRRTLQAQTKILKKSSKHQINQSVRKFSKKNYVSYLKSVKEQNIRIGATRRNLQAQPKMLKKIVGTANQRTRTKIFLRKLCFVPSKCTGAKNS
jgi:hypothetical protein